VALCYTVLHAVSHLHVLLTLPQFYSMYFGYASTHEKHVWESRMEPQILEAFEKLWGTHELISSFDGCNITLPRQKDLTWSPW
jgi:hypothetical protein